MDIFTGMGPQRNCSATPALLCCGFSTGLIGGRLDRTHANCGMYAPPAVALTPTKEEPLSGGRSSGWSRPWGASIGAFRWSCLCSPR